MARDIFRSGPAGEVGVKKTLAAAIQQMGAGRPDEAVRLLESEGGAALKTHVGQNILGDIFLKQGKHKEALRAFDTAVRFMPSSPEAYCNRGVALQELGRLEEALAAEDRAIRLRPEYAGAHYNRGNILMAMLRLDDAVAAFGRATKAQPALAEAFFNRGLALLALKRPLEALADFGRTLAIRPNYVAAHSGRAGALRDLGRHDEAVAAINTALTLEPDNVDAAHLRCSALIAAERYAESLAAADLIIARDANDAKGHTARAQALVKLQRLPEALAAADTAVGLMPGDQEAQTMRGIVLGEMGRLEESLAALNEARRFGASGKAYFHARAVALATLGDPNEAFADFERSLAIDPDNVEAYKNRAYLRLALGDWKDGWVDHEWRLKARDHAHNNFVQTAPKWTGENLRGKQLLVYGEQGYGDTIQFVRYLRLIEDRGAEITLVVGEPVRRLFTANFPRVDVTASVGMRTGFDYQISLMSMPYALGTTLETLPAETPYLFAEEERIAKWRQRLGTEGFRVGIVWQGSRKYLRDHDRSIPLVQYAPLGRVPGVRLISVQSQVGLEQLNALPDGMRVETLGEEIVANPDGFREVAAVMANLDLLIMSDTGPTHLAGALARPVWVPLARQPDWRWMREREDTPWYPTMRLFRQKTAGDWPEVFARLARELERRAG